MVRRLSMRSPFVGWLKLDLRFSVVLHSRILEELEELVPPDATENACDPVGVTALVLQLASAGTGFVPPERYLSKDYREQRTKVLLVVSQYREHVVKVAVLSVPVLGAWPLLGSGRVVDQLPFQKNRPFIQESQEAAIGIVFFPGRTRRQPEAELSVGQNVPIDISAEK